MISDDLLKISQIANVEEANYEQANENDSKSNTDSSSRTSSSKEKKKEKAKKKLTKPKSQDTLKQERGYGEKFKDFVCTKRSLNIDLINLRLNFDRILKWGIPYPTCSGMRKLSALDAVNNTSNFIKNNPGVLAGVFQKDGWDKSLDAMLKSSLVNKLGAFGLTNALTTCLLGKSSRSLYGNGAMNGPLSSRNALKEKLLQDNCGMALSQIPFVNKILDNAVVGHVFNAMMGEGGSKAYEYTMAALGVSGLRSTVLGGMVSSIMYSREYNTRGHLYLAFDVMNSGQLTKQDYISLKADSRFILDALDKDKEKNNPKTLDPSTDFDKVIDVITKVDQTWAKDDNFSITKGNKSLTELANGKLLSKKKTISLTGNYTTEVKAEHHISIINQFAGTNTDTGVTKNSISSATFSSSSASSSCGCAS